MLPLKLTQSPLVPQLIRQAAVTETLVAAVVSTNSTSPVCVEDILSGGGSKKAIDKHTSLKSDLQDLLESTTLDDPEPAAVDLQERVPIA